MNLQEKTDYRWRKFQVTYIAVTLTVFVVSCIAVFMYNSRQVCGEVMKNMGGGFYDAWTCSSAASRGLGVNPSLLILEAVIIIAGYFLLPHLYRYLAPGTSELHC